MCVIAGSTRNMSSLARSLMDWTWSEKWRYSLLLSSQFNTTPILFLLAPSPPPPFPSLHARSQFLSVALIIFPLGSSFFPHTLVSFILLPVSSPYLGFFHLTPSFFPLSVAYVSLFLIPVFLTLSCKIKNLFNSFTSKVECRFTVLKSGDFILY